ncbi:MAG: hypothetical protein AB7C97_01435 [Oscillospiraceae bacterium]
MTVHDISEIFKPVVLEADRKVEAVFCCDLLSVAMARAPQDAAWVTVIGNANVVAVATLADVSCVVIAEGYSFDQAAIEAAKGRITLLRSDKPIYETAVRIGSSL